MRLTSFALLFALAGFACRGETPMAPGPGDQAGGPRRGSLTGASIPDRWIVVLKDDASTGPYVIAGVLPRQTYTHAIRGFSIDLPEATALALAQDPRVLFVERDGVVTASSTQANAPWGLDRIDQGALPLNRTFSFLANGTGVAAYVIDTGIRLTHNEFGARAASLVDVIDGGTADDCDGHGTHVAGTVGGATYGVAKNVSLHAVRVLDCNGSGTWSGVIAGIDAVIAHHQAGTPAVANLSLGGGPSNAVDLAIRNLIADGVATAVAAGNEYDNACNHSPARVADAMTVSATNKKDKRPGWANWGPCVDWFAPGDAIVSSWNASNTATARLSGTSMASPHTAGVAALYLQLNPLATPAQVAGALRSGAAAGVVVGPRSTANLLLFTNY